MRAWRGRGKGRTGNNNPSLSLGAGPGMGSGRPGAQPNNDFGGGAGMGGGRPGAQPTNGFGGGAGMGGGRPGAQPTNSFGGGPGMGSGRPGAQPTNHFGGGPGMGSGRPGVQPVNHFGGGPGMGSGRPGIQPTLQARVDFGDETRTWNIRASVSTTVYRASGSIQASGGGTMDTYVADPEGNFYFALEVNGTEIAHFQECSGLKSVTEPFELIEGGMNHRVHKLPGQSRWENITLRYGVTKDTTLADWRNDILQDGFGKRRNGSIILYTLDGSEVRRYNFVEAWPVSWEGPSFASSGSEIAVETLEICHNGIQIT